MNRIISILATAITVVLVTGCAISYENENRRGIFGFAWVEYRSGDRGKKDSSLKIGKETLGQAAPVVQQKTLGFYFDVSGNSPGMGLGYRDVIVVVPEVDAETHVDYDTTDPLSARFKVERK